MSDRAWKAFERRLARQLGTHRIPVTGERAGADFRDGLFAYQAKLGRRCPAYLREWLAGIVAAGERRGLVGVVVWKPKGTRDRDALVVLRFADWRELHVGTVRDATAPTIPGERLETPPVASGTPLSPRSLCARAGCGNPLPSDARRRGSPRRYCSSWCRRADWVAHRDAERIA
jgi:hypothetical protein